MRHLIVIAALGLTACGSTNPVTGQQNPVLVYAKGKCTITGMGAAGISMAAGQNGFAVTSDCGPGAYIYVGPPPANFTPAALEKLP